MTDSLIFHYNNFLQQVPFVGILLGLMLMDIIAGLSAAFVEGKTSSLRSWRGMVRKGALLMAIGFGALIDMVIVQVGPTQAAAVVPLLAKTFALLFIVSESISILESFKRLGVPIPARIYSVLDQLATKSHDPPPIVEVKHASVVEMHVQGSTVQTNATTTNTTTTNTSTTNEIEGGAASKKRGDSAVLK